MSFVILGSSRESKLRHWQEIKKRVRTHEGEMLSGEKGKRYQEKYSKKYLGRDLNTKPLTVTEVEQYERKKAYDRNNSTK